MTTAFAALLIGVAGAALVLALVAYFWVNRTPSPNERFDEYGRVPLFGVDLVAGPNATTPTTEVREPVHAVEESAVVADPHVSYKPRAAKSEPVDRMPQGDPIAIDNSAVANHEPTSAASQPLEELPPRHHQSDHRFGGAGWGASPGWPAPEVPTPRYVPPIRDDSRPRPEPATAASPAPSNGKGVYANGIPGSMVEGQQLRFSTPAEGTLQFLPGRLEIASGLDNGREIRFVRLPGPNGTEVTFGRNEGALYRHIQLRDQTVSREHARMALIDGHWLLTNLSKTNPVAHNGRVLGPGEHQLLTDGDRLDMGEVIFSFRSR
ncbi:MAG: FHA domain-containing protein [Gemmatimonadaceae bacterium]